MTTYDLHLSKNFRIISFWQVANDWGTTFLSCIIDPLTYCLLYFFAWHQHCSMAFNSQWILGKTDIICSTPCTGPMLSDSRITQAVPVLSDPQRPWAVHSQDRSLLPYSVFMSLVFGFLLVWIPFIYYNWAQYFCFSADFQIIVLQIRWVITTRYVVS